MGRNNNDKKNSSGNNNAKPKDSPSTTNTAGGNTTKPQASQSKSWYDKETNLYNQATSISKYFTTGSPIKLECTSGSFSVIADEEIPAPGGVVTMVVAPTLGTLYQNSDPANKCALHLYNLVRGRYTSTLPFQSPDLLAFIGALGSIFACVAEIEKELNWVNLYAPGNKNIPAGLFKSAGTTFDAERLAYADNVFRLGTELNRLHALTVPANLSYFSKMYWTFKNFWYIDYSGMKGSILHNFPHYFYKWSSAVETIDNPSILASGLVPVRVAQGSISYKIDILSELIDALVYNDDVLNMSGWLEQYTRNGKMVFADTLLTNIAEEPIHSEQLLVQVENARLTHRNLGKIRQNVSEQCLIDRNSRLIWANEQSGWNDVRDYITGWFVNYPVEPDANTVMESTRLAPVPSEIIEEGTSRYVDYKFDTIVPLTMFYTYRRYPSNDLISVEYEQFTRANIGSSTTEHEFHDILKDVNISKIVDGCPAKVIGYFDDGVAKHYQALMDTDFCFPISHDSMAKLHEVALLSEFKFDPSDYQ